MRGAGSGGRCRVAGTGGRCRGAGTGGRCRGAGTGLEGAADGGLAFPVDGGLEGATDGGVEFPRAVACSRKPRTAAGLKVRWLIGLTGEWRTQEELPLLYTVTHMTSGCNRYIFEKNLE